MANICIIGEVVIDFHWPKVGAEPKMRLGGILHAARAAWAANIPYSIGYIAPAYLDEQIQNYARQHGARHAVKIGNVMGSPNVIAIGEPREIGQQFYENLLRDEKSVEVSKVDLEQLLRVDDFSDVLLFPQDFALDDVVEAVGASSPRIYIDINATPATLTYLTKFGRQVECAILSTSSELFKSTPVPSALRSQLKGIANTFLLKENRGGCRLFYPNDQETVVEVGAQQRVVQHSVGVGDCFDVIFAGMRWEHDDVAALSYATWVAAEYACTTYPDDFRSSAQLALKMDSTDISTIAGTSLPWERRPGINIYIAAPDFDFVDRSPIDALCTSLTYHNFSPRRPVLENGQMRQEATKKEKQRLYAADMSLLDACQVLVAVMLYDDPGTLIEIGIAAERGLPVIVYDPFRRAENVMLAQVPSLVSSDLDEVISAVFKAASTVRDDK